MNQELRIATGDRRQKASTIQKWSIEQPQQNGRMTPDRRSNNFSARIAVALCNCIDRVPRLSSLVRGCSSARTWRSADRGRRVPGRADVGVSFIAVVGAAGSTENRFCARPLGCFRGCQGEGRGGKESKRDSHGTRSLRPFAARYR